MVADCRQAAENARLRYNHSMLQATEKIWHNGRLIPWDDAKIHVLAHVVSYGSSVFEGIRCYDTEQGSAIFRAADHARDRKGGENADEKSR